MTRASIAGATSLILALGACDSGKIVKAENASIAGVAEAAKGAVTFEPGKAVASCHRGLAHDSRRPRILLRASVRTTV